MKKKQPSIEQYIEDLKESKMLGQLFLENADEAHYFYSIDRKLIYVSPAFLNITGYTTQELHEKNFIPFVHPDDQAWTTKLWQGLFKGEFFEDIEYRIIKKDGEVRWNSSSWRMVSDKDGRQIGILGKQQDITKRKMAELALIESEQFEHLLFEESPIGLLLSRMNGEMVDINPAFASILGRTVEETLKLNYWEITPEKYATNDQRQLELLEKTGRNGPYEKEYIHKNGSLVPVRLSGRILERGGEIFIWSSVENIIELKQSEQVLQRSEVLEKLATGASLKDILASLVINAEKRSPGTLCSALLLDNNGNHLRHGAAPSLPHFYNKAIDGIEIGSADCPCGEAALTGKRVIVEDVMAYPYSNNYRELARKAGLQASLSEPIMSSTGLMLGVFTIYYPDPHEPQQQDMKFIQDSARLAGIAIEHKQAEELLRAERDNAQRYLDTVEAVVVALDSGGRISLVNRKACELLGYEERELLGKNWFDSFLPSDEKEAVQQVFQELVKGNAGLVEYYENAITTRNGEERLIAWHNNILRDNDNNIIGTLGAGEDITERKRAEEKTFDLLQQNRELTQRLFQTQEQERRHLARELHDEHGQWLTALRMHAHLLDVRYSGSEPDMRDSIEIIEKITSQMHESIRKMIRELRPVDLELFGLEDSLQELVDRWQKLYPQIQCVLSIKGVFDDIDNMLGVTIYRIIQESLTNVAKHAEASNVSIQLDRNTDETDNTDYLFLQIQDNGKGFNLDEASKGYGLAGMRERILSARGECVFNNLPGDGALIEVRLPTSPTDRRKDH